MEPGRFATYGVVKRGLLIIFGHGCICDPHHQDFGSSSPLQQFDRERLASGLGFTE
jgi:hypothetical protein